MADEIDAGRIVAEIVLETKQAQEAAEEFAAKMDELNAKKASPTVTPKLDEATLSYIQGSLEQLGITGAKAADVISKGFSDTTNAKRYSDALEKLAAGLERCENAKRQYESVDDTAGVERCTQALSKLNDMYSRVQAQMDAYVASVAKFVENTNQVDSFSVPDIATEEVTLKAQSYADTVVYIRRQAELVHAQ